MRVEHISSEVGEKGGLGQENWLWLRPGVGKNSHLSGRTIEDKLAALGIGLAYQREASQEEAGMELVKCWPGTKA
jgi:hypothetical protein